MGSRDAGRAKEVAGEIGAADSGTYADAVAQSNTLLLAVNWWDLERSPSSETSRARSSSTAPIRTRNTYSQHEDLGGSSAAQEIQKRLPGARAVKGWNHVFADIVNTTPDFGGVAASVFLAPMTVQVLPEPVDEPGVARPKSGEIHNAGRQGADPGDQLPRREELISERLPSQFEEGVGVGGSVVLGLVPGLPKVPQKALPAGLGQDAPHDLGPVREDLELEARADRHALLGPLPDEGQERLKRLGPVPGPSIGTGSGRKPVRSSGWAILAWSRIG